MRRSSQERLFREHLSVRLLFLEARRPGCNLQHPGGLRRGGQGPVGPEVLEQTVADGAVVLADVFLQGEHRRCNLGKYVNVIVYKSMYIFYIYLSIEHDFQTPITLN